MGRFLALCAADGVQVIVEAQSDHVICLAVLEDKHPLRREDVLIHSFLNEPHEGKQVFLAIEIDKRGLHPEPAWLLRSERQGSPGDSACAPPGSPNREEATRNEPSQRRSSDGRSILYRRGRTAARR